MITLIGLDDFPTAIDVLATPLADGRTAIACTHFPTPGTSEIAYSAVYLVASNGVATKVGRSEPFGKDVACALSINGTTLRLWVTEPPPGGSGAQTQVHFYDFPIGVGLPSGGGTTIDATARQQIAQLRTYLRNTP